jgi:transcriptional regulator with XRE-family HTH domain
MVYFYTNLRHLRIRRGWKQEDLAAKLFVKPNTISNYENNKSSPDFEILDVIIKLFGVTADQILFKDLADDQHISVVNDEPPDYINKGDPGTFNFMKVVLDKLSTIENEMRIIKTQTTK